MTVIQLPTPGNQWQFSVDVERRPDGKLVAVLVDARTSLIESGSQEPHIKLNEIASLLEEAIVVMREEASKLRPLR